MKHSSLYFRIAAITALLLLVPLIAMLFTDEVKWGVFDFVVMGLLIFLSASAFAWIAKRVSPTKGIIAGLTISFAFLLIWAELAVGVFTNLGS